MRCRGRCRSTSSTSASTASTRCARSTSTRSTSARRSCRRTRTRRWRRARRRARRAYQTDLLRAYRGYGSDHASDVRRLADVSLAPVLVQPPVPERPVVRLQRHDRPVDTQQRRRAPAARRGWQLRRSGADQAEADELLGNNAPQTHLMRANFVWDLPDLKQRWRRAARRSAWSSTTGSSRASGPARPATPYTVSFGYQSGGGNVNLTGSPDFGAAHPRSSAIPGSGLQRAIVYRQFNTAAFQGPLNNSVGLESGSDYLRGCFSSVLDLAIARNIRLGGAGICSCASTCSTRRTRRASPAGTRR